MQSSLIPPGHTTATLSVCVCVFVLTYVRMLEPQEEFFRAYGDFERLMRDPAFHYRIQLDEGDFLIYDNYRMLHGRPFARPI